MYAEDCDLTVTALILKGFIHGFTVIEPLPGSRR
jgi:hypothetical protein